MTRDVDPVPSSMDDSLVGLYLGQAPSGLFAPVCNEDRCLWGVSGGTLLCILRTNQARASIKVPFCVKFRLTGS